MTKMKLVGVNALNEIVKLSKEVYLFSDMDGKVSVTIEDSSTVKLVTSKGVFFLKKHPTLNIYQGVMKSSVPKARDYKCHIILKKVVGELIYWPPASK
jgi:hypothetical protein